jgi:hypothetical protein
MSEVALPQGPTCMSQDRPERPAELIRGLAA